MSTALTIIEHEKAGRLKRFLPLLRGAEREVRMLTVTAELHAWIYDDGAAGELAKNKGMIRGQLGEFVKGEEIDNEVFMKRVEDRRQPSKSFHHGVWSIRARFNPQHRFFGMFALTDWFIVFSKQDRDSLEKSQAAWHAQIDLCQGLWRGFFPNQLPITGNNLYQYISENVEACDERWHTD